MIHRQALESRTLPSDLQSALNIAIKMVNFVKTSALNTRLFSKLCKDMSADCTTLLYHIDGRWLSKSNKLSGVFQLREQFAEFFGRKRQEFATYFNDPSFVECLAYLADIFEKLNTLNLSMKENKITIINLYAFVEKLEFWQMHVMKGVLVMFDRLSSVIRANESINITEEVAEYLCKLEEELKHYFPERIVMNENLKIVRNPINANFSSCPCISKQNLLIQKKSLNHEDCI